MWSHRYRNALAGLALVAAGTQTIAQPAPPQPYAGLQTREIKAFSDEEIADLRAGRGMGLALPAELNGYPGPSHVLDLAAQLGLSEQQRASVKDLFDSMKAEAVPIGQKLLAAERDLNRQFAERTVTPERLQAATIETASIRGELRYTHLKYHLSTAALLTPDQIRRYTELRGYAGAPAAGMHPGHGGQMPMPGMTGGTPH
jgi:LTXXQ motif family protein